MESLMEIFKILEQTKPGKGGEIQLTDALRVMAKNGNVYAYNFKGKRYDTGNKLGYLKAMVEFALRREDIGPGFREYLKTLEMAKKECEKIDDFSHSFFIALSIIPSYSFRIQDVWLI